jgi:hypothetical protein
MSTQYKFIDLITLTIVDKILRFAESQGKLLGNGTINSDATMKHVTPLNVTDGSTAVKVFSMRSALRAMSYNNRSIVGSCVSCWVRPEAILRGPAGKASQGEA